jgi:hypothetical protein
MTAWLHPAARYGDLYALGTLVLAEPLLVPAPDAGLLACVLHDGAGRIFLDDDGRLPLVSASPTTEVACAVEARAASFCPGATIGALVPIGRLRDPRDPAALGLAVMATVIGGVAVTNPVPAPLAIQGLSRLEAALVRDAFCVLERGVPAPPREEIDSVAAHPLRHAIHRSAVAPLMEPFSSRPLRARVRAALGDAESIVDISCGDDRLILSLAAEGRTCVANDVCLQLMRAHGAEGAANGVTYTLHNVVDLPYAIRFDAAICKNTLHHLSAAETTATLAQLRCIADEVVVVDVLDIRASRRARAFNAYYRRFLGDQGRHFLRDSEFRQQVAGGFPGRPITFDHLDTVKGRYAIAHVHKETNHEHR